MTAEELEKYECTDNPREWWGNYQGRESPLVSSRRCRRTELGFAPQRAAGTRPELCLLARLRCGCAAMCCSCSRFGLAGVQAIDRGIHRPL